MSLVQKPVQDKKGFGYSKLKASTDGKGKGFTIQSYQKDVKVKRHFIIFSLCDIAM